MNNGVNFTVPDVSLLDGGMSERGGLLDTAGLLGSIYLQDRAIRAGLDPFNRPEAAERQDPVQPVQGEPVGTTNAPPSFTFNTDQLLKVSAVALAVGVALYAVSQAGN